MIKIKKLLKNLIYAIAILIIIFIYKAHEKNTLNKINSFNFFMINTAINNKDKKTIKYKIKDFNNTISHKLEHSYKIIIKNKEKHLTLNKKNLNNKKIKNKINIFR